MSRFAIYILAGALLSTFALPRAEAFTVLGGLVGDDLTDRGNDGIEANYNPPGDFGGFDAEFFASSNPAFNSGESAFNVFDNLADGGVNKWCCGPVSNTVTARILLGPHVLTGFTLTSSNDTPARDPRVWEIQGSNDGTTFTTLFRRDNPGASIWGNNRNQTIRFSAADGDTFLVTDQAFSYFRMATHSTGGAFFALSEVEFFGTPNLPPEIHDLDGDNLVFTPGSGPLPIDQGTVASAVDPLEGPAGWNGGNLSVDIVLGGVPTEDALTIAGGTGIGSVSGGTAGNPLLVTFNTNATTALVSALLGAIHYENLSPTPTPGSRVVEIVLSDGNGGVSPAATVTITLNVGGAVSSYVWDGGGDGSSFIQAANWVGDAGFPDANDIAIFRSELGTGAGQVDLGGTRFVGEIRFDGDGSFTLLNGPLATDTVHQQATATGTNGLSAQLSSFAFSGTVEGGTLRPSHPANPASLLTGTWAVQAGGTLVQTGGYGLGLADIQLDGGQLTLAPDPATAVARFVQVINNGTVIRRLHIGELEVFLPGVSPAVNHAGGAGSLNPATDLAVGSAGASIFEKNATANFVNDHGGNDDARLLDAAETTAGNVFGIAGSEAFVTVDLGSSRGIGIIRLHQRNDGCCQDRLRDFSVHLFADNAGLPGALVGTLAYTNQPANNSFGELVFSTGIATNPVESTLSLLADSSIQLDPGTDAILGELRVPGPASLSVDAPDRGNLSFTGDVDLDGTLTLATTGMPTISLHNVGGTGGLALSGDGLLLLPTANSYAGLTEIQGGTVEAGTGSSLGDTGQGTVVEAGGGLRVSTGTFAEALSLDGSGNAVVDGALNKQPGANVDWDGPITVTGDARIFSSGNSLFLDGGITLASNVTLNVDAQNRIRVRNTGIVGGSGTTLRFEGNDRTDLTVANPAFLGDIEIFNDGRLDLHAGGALGDAAGLTRVLGGNSTLVLRNGRTQVEDLEIEGDGRGTEGAIRNDNNNNTLQGTITLTGDAQIVTRINSTLTLDGPVGGTNLVQRETGTLILTRDNSFTHFDLVGGGTVRIQAANGLGGTSAFSVDTGETLAFEGNLLIDGGSNLNQLEANDGTISAFSGTTRLDLSLVTQPDKPLRFSGDGNLEVVQGFGNAATGTNLLEKTGAGQLSLLAANTYLGDTSVMAGTLHAANSGALGPPTADLALAPLATLALSGDITVLRNAISLEGTGATNQPGTLVNADGSNTLRAAQYALPFFSEAEIRVASSGGHLSLDGPLDLQYGDLSTDGAGDIAITGNISAHPVSIIPNARFVQVLKNIPGQLHVGELEVFAPGTSAVNNHVAGGGPLNNPDDLARSPTATIFSSSTGTGHGAADAVIDGLEQTAGATWTHAQSGGAPTAEITVDLGSSLDIESVRVHQRNDACCQQRLENFTVNLFADNGGSPGARVGSATFPGRPAVNLFGELTLIRTADSHLAKMGSGTVTLSGTNNYTGGTSIAGGIVVASGNASTGTGPVLVEQGGVLSGTGSVAGDVWIGVQGTLSPGVSPGVLPIGSDLVFSNFSSVYVAELDNPTPAGVDRLDLGGDIDLNNATLDLQRDPGYLPTASDTLVIATYGGNITGTFNNLPEGAALSAQGEAFTISYTAGQVTLTATGDQRVYAGPDTMTRTDTNSVSVDLATLLANDLTGAGPGPLSVLSVMPDGVNGGGITLSNDMVTYTPPPGYIGGDSFTYVVSDGTDNAIGLVNVTVGSTPSGIAAVGDPGRLEYLPNGDYRIAFVGTPGASYQIQWTQDIRTLPVNWQVLGSVVADPLGDILIDHANPPGTTLYYRAALE